MLWPVLLPLALVVTTEAPSVAAETSVRRLGQASHPSVETGPLTISDGELEKYRAEPGCEGAAFDIVKLMLDISDLSAAARIHARKLDAIEYGQQAAISYNRVAQVAADKGCPVIARRLWLSVIEKYIGTGYAAQRQRAQIGIDDLRNAAASPRLSLRPPAAAN